MNEEIYKDDYSSDNNINLTQSSSFSPNEKKSLVKIKKSNVWSSNSCNNSKSDSPESNKKKKRISETRDMLSFKTYLDDDENFQEEEKLPDSIEGNYFYDYNILTIDEILMKKFDQDKNNKLKKLKKHLDDEKEKIAGRQNLLERKSSRKKIKEI